MMSREQQIKFMEDVKRRSEDRASTLMRDPKVCQSVRRPLPSACPERLEPEVEDGERRRVM